MNFIDLGLQQNKIRGDLDSRISAILDHGQYVMGPEVTELEKELARYIGVKHAVACSSGTDALLMALMALGVGPGDAVLTPSFTFVATAEVVSLAGATPVFIDIDRKTFNLDPAKIAGAIDEAKGKGLNPKGIIPVDLFGLPADYGAIEKIAKENSLFVIEDGCQGFGGELSGKRLCGFGDFSATSFYPAKPLGCYGDGGAVFTDNDDAAEKLRSIRVHGMGQDRYDNVRIGLNGRMDSIQAAVLLSKLTIFDDELAARRRVAETYTAELDGVVKTPKVPDGMKSGWAQYSVMADNRDEVLAKLKEDGVPTTVFYPIPLHLQIAYKNLGYKEGDLPVSEDVAKRIFSLPMHPYLTDEEIEQVTTAVKKAVS